MKMADPTGHSFTLQTQDIFRAVNLHDEFVEDELLMQEVQQYDCIWNTSSRAYKENPKKQEAGRKIAIALGQNGKYSLTSFIRHINYQKFRLAFS